MQAQPRFQGLFPQAREKALGTRLMQARSHSTTTTATKTRPSYQKSSLQRLVKQRSVYTKPHFFIEIKSPNLLFFY